MTNDSLTKHDHVLLSLVMQFQTIAMIQLGKMADPHSGELHRNLDAARGTIDVLEMLKVKCRDNTPAELVQLLDKSVMDLQMNYLDEVKKSDSTDADADSEAGDDGNSTETPAEDETS